ncbi:Clavaminate synthase-like protein [Artomyces pyxidatus]|uniref:Clavaminate synthase-like protein n=1 Tax=Artomyces pyxidatus TaxID=48021 RepID=A0ACB8ST65_9AGAM|nr:Clavaminate synthase-like protein [Artomyces pyxidatus]
MKRVSESCQVLDELADDAYQHLLVARRSDTLPWRRLYTEASLMRTLADLMLQRIPDEATIELCIARLDRILVIAGAPGADRRELVLLLISKIQKDHLPSEPFRCLSPSTLVPSLDVAAVLVLAGPNAVPRHGQPPSISVFQRRLRHEPFLLPGFASDWPAMNEHPWRSLEYLRSVAGRGRIVPVEVGGDYRTDDWTQELIAWESFLDSLDETQRRDQRIVYMAQHNILDQFPSLRADIIVPDYAYTSLSPPSGYPQYRPPANDEQLVINAWLGPKGTVSPGHTDPYFNLYAQIVGRKTVWLAPPSASAHMYPYPPPVSAAPADSVHNPATNNLEPSMSNTTKVDVFCDRTNESRFAMFWEKVVPTALSVTLEPGDVLFFPPGWWHAMRSEDTSFSVSMWF